MAVKFHSSGDAILSYCTVFSMYITSRSMESQSDALLLLLYYSDFFYFAQYVCVKLSKCWQAFYDTPGQRVDSTGGINETPSQGLDISLGESLPFFTTPISLLPFHVVFKIGLDRGCFYQFVCFLRLFSLYQDERIKIDWGPKSTLTQPHTESVPLNRSSSHYMSSSTSQEANVQTECQCNCRFRREDFEDSPDSFSD